MLTTEALTRLCTLTCDSGSYLRRFVCRGSLWETADGRQNLASGKAILSALFNWVQDEFGVSLTAAALIRSMRPAEVHEEVRLLLDSIIRRRPLADHP
jgi:hypothetical protein